MRSNLIKKCYQKSKYYNVEMFRLLHLLLEHFVSEIKKFELEILDEM